LGAAAVDVACALGLQDLVVGTSGLPLDADTYLPRPLVDLPVVPASDVVAPEDAAAAARDLSPDVIVLAAAEDRDPSVVRALSEVAPTVVYDSDVPDWADATEAISDASGRPRARRDHAPRHPGLAALRDRRGAGRCGGPAARHARFADARGRERPAAPGPAHP